MGSDDDYIYVDHSNDEPVDEIKQKTQEDGIDSKVDFKVKKEQVNVVDEPEEKPIDEEKVDLGSDDDYIYVDHSSDEPVDEGTDDELKEQLDDEKVDLGSDDDYIYVDHSNDEPLKEEETVGEIDKKPHVKSRRGQHVKSFISDMMTGESQLEPREVETLRGEIIPEDDTPLHKPAPKDDYVVEAEIVNGDEELNALNDNLPDWGDEDIHLKRPTPKGIFQDDELNALNDDFSDDEIHDEAMNVVNNAMREFIDEVFDNEEEDDKKEVPPQKEAVNNESVQEEIPQEEDVDEDIYYKGATDVNNPLRKNNVYYSNDEYKNKTLKGSLKGIKKDMQYINKSLNEIQNPTEIDYVSVVDRTEEFDINEYLSRPSDDDSDKIIQREEEKTFAEAEEERIEKELRIEALQKEISSDENVIVPVHEHERRQDLKDQALEDIILSADEDYKEIEKERHRKDNQLKAFDDQKLPGKKRLEDDIFDYVQAENFGLDSSDDLYKQPIDKVARSIDEIVAVEGPIHVSEVTKRVKDSCNIKRAGSNLKNTVQSAIDSAENSGSIIRIGDFLYDASNNEVVIRKRNKPNIELISDEEIAKSIELVLLHNSNISTNQIAKLTSRNFGFRSTSKKTATRINGVLDLMIANNRVKIQNDIVELN